MKQFFSPIWNSLIEHMKKDPNSFHVPGHGSGKIWSMPLFSTNQEELPADWYESIMQLDLTELSSTDDLHYPEASIKEAQELAAKTFGAEKTFFLVGGSTSGNLALILTLCGPGDLILVQRNVHKSIINGLRLAEAKAVFLSPSIDPLSGLATIPSIHTVEESLRQYPEAVAVLLTNPNYYGMSTTLKPYAELIHRYGKPLAVDEAHGAHYGFHPLLPVSAVAAGADIVVQSAHKTLPTLTMGGLLHIQGKRVNRDHLKDCLSMIQSSSPSFPILASIDISRAMIDQWGSVLFEQALAVAAELRDWLSMQKGPIVEMPVERSDTRQFYDPLRLVLFDQSGQLTGFELQHSMEKHGCYVEMADAKYMVLVLGIHLTHEDGRRLQHAIIETVEHYQLNSNKGAMNDHITDTIESISAPVSFSRDWFNHSNIERITLVKAIGRQSAEMVTPYPPGIPLLYKGERITEDVVQQLEKLAAAGARFQGLADPSAQEIAVYREELL